MAAGTKKFPHAPNLTEADNGNHTPGPESIWQESSLVCFCDPDAQLAGFHRIGIHPNKSEANIYSWTQVGGRIISSAKLVCLPLPAGSITNSEAAGVRISTLDPLMSYRYQVDRDGVQTDVVFSSFTGPVFMSLDIGKAVVAPGHYNMLGAVRGTIVAEGKTHAFNGVGFQDHSWGPRDGGKILGHRWIMAVFDERNLVCSIPTIGPGGRGVVGYMMLDGEMAPVTKTQSSFTIADDNMRIEGCHALIEDHLGRTLEVTGRAVGEDCLQPYGQGYFAVHGPAVFESARGKGRGYLEWSPMRFVPPWRQEALGISEDNPWLNTGAR